MDFNLDDIIPPLPKQARLIAKLVRQHGSLKRDELLEAMQDVVKTKQLGGANRILTYYQNKLWHLEKIIRVQKSPE